MLSTVELGGGTATLQVLASALRAYNIPPQRPGKASTSEPLPGSRANKANRPTGVVAPLDGDKVTLKEEREADARAVVSTQQAEKAYIYRRPTNVAQKNRAESKHQTDDFNTIPAFVRPDPAQLYFSAEANLPRVGTFLDIYV